MAREQQQISWPALRRR